MKIARGNVSSQALSACLVESQFEGCATQQTLRFQATVSGVAFTSPVRKIEGNFSIRVLTSSGTESAIFFKEGGESNRDWFSLKQKLDDFTSGFRTRYADMAGGWEEVIAVGSGIRTGAGTGF